MATESKIEWTDATWNPWQGCTKVSEACTYCYMFSDLKRYGRDGSIVVRSKDPTFFLPLKRRRTGEFAIPPGSKVFTCSWSDWFHERADAWRPKAWSIIQQRPDLVFQIVTKRPERIEECLPPDWGSGYPNCWLIATVENQHWADVRIPQLLKVPAVVHGLSMEPLLGPVILHKYLAQCQCGHGHGFTVCPNTGGVAQTCHHCDCRRLRPVLSWSIVGGESGHFARPMQPAWARSIRDQCRNADTSFFFKQWGELLPFDHCAAAGVNLSMDDALNHASSGAPVRVGKKKSGRLLDGREWSEFPSNAGSRLSDSPQIRVPGGPVQKQPI